MSKSSDASDDTSRWVKILDEVEDYRLGKLFRIIKATLKHRLLDGSMSEPITRINFERNDSVCVLLYHDKKDVVILVRQFRYPIYAGLRPESRAGEGARDAWLLETVAGIVEEGETILDVANRELLEEVGYRVKGPLQLITTMHPSPGGSSERITLFLGKVDDVQREETGGGVKAEGEDIEVVAIPFTKAMVMIENGEIRDAKTIIALQYLALRQK